LLSSLSLLKGLSQITAFILTKMVPIRASKLFYAAFIIVSMMGGEVGPGFCERVQFSGFRFKCCSIGLTLAISNEQSRSVNG
jgi:hypothetical protein